MIQLVEHRVRLQWSATRIFNIFWEMGLAGTDTPIVVNHERPPMIPLFMAKSVDQLSVIKQQTGTKG